MPSEPVSSPFISCEDLLPPVLGVFNIYATITSVPLLCVPLSSLLKSAHLHDVKQRAPFIHQALRAWLVTLTLLFFTNLSGHALGGHLCIRLHEVMTAVQGLWHSCWINAMRRREGWRSVPDHAGFVAAAIATASVAACASGLGEALGAGGHETATGIVMALTGPYIVGNHGALAWKDAHAWKLFMRSCAGLVLMLSLTGPHGLEKQICHLSGSIVYHAVVDHACIVCLFGGVAKNAVHLTNLAAAKMATL